MTHKRMLRCNLKPTQLTSGCGSFSTTALRILRSGTSSPGCKSTNAPPQSSFLIFRQKFEYHKHKKPYHHHYKLTFKLGKQQHARSAKIILPILTLKNICLPWPAYKIHSYYTYTYLNNHSALCGQKRRVSKGHTKGLLKVL